MRNLFTGKIAIILVLAVVLALVLSIFGGIMNKNPLDLAVQGALAPLRAAATALTTTAEKYYGYMFRYEALAAENEVLKKQIAEMEDTARQALLLELYHGVCGVRALLAADHRGPAGLCGGSLSPQGRVGIRPAGQAHL